ncbi:OmpA family protein [Pseudobacter ginsenosidimutans]|uniref:Outer membrane protein OmpA-like peptidoglycan-associated protein n=1 Tax=Pseudobacter ginsenosidimutans TaxID=661488 RepID=A0A4Q7MZF8_9BACT|nr:OmpA family protein [Pseudobacter ginsenosidimutans]QEC40656.1 OmpA family protein [Pseudobacter ginsenosidimutans]RZS72623.1 outer membrane protein OmpA-like peptidoglycan-associated protein [Pseudobacter ginsenosidimutans]
MKRKSIRKNLFAAGCLMVMAVSASAQKQEFSIAAGGGLQGINYSMKHGDVSLKPGFQLGFGYMRSIGRRWGIRTGVELGLYQSKVSLDPGTQFTSYEIDSENSAFEYRVKANGYREEQKFWALKIPVMLQLHPEFNKNGLYAQLGVQLGLPVSNSYSTSADQISATGYYPDYNLEITELPVHGFGTQNGWKGKGEYDFNLSWSAAAELGWRFRIAANNNLYAGFYVDYGLNNIKKSEGEGSLLNYQPEGLAQSKAAGVFSLKNETGNARLMAYGIKLRIGFGSGKTKKKIEPPPAPPPPPPPALVIDTPVVVTPVPVEPVVIESVVVSEVHADSLTDDEMKLLGSPFLFGKVGDTTLSASAKQHVIAIAEILKKHPELIVNIEGHTCNIGTDAVNKRIGLGRANAVAAALKAEGVDAGSLQTTSRAHLQPVAPNNSEANRKKNRRVVLIIL